MKLVDNRTPKITTLQNIPQGCCFRYTASTIDTLYYRIENRELGKVSFIDLVTGTYFTRNGTEEVIPVDAEVHIK